MIAAQICDASPFMKNVMDPSARIFLRVNVNSAIFGSPSQTIMLSITKLVTSAPLMLLPRLWIACAGGRELLASILIFLAGVNLDAN